MNPETKAASNQRAETIARDNNFNTLRLLAAMAVLVSHTIPMTLGDNQHEILYRLSGGQTSGGGVAVDVFFAISGYLVTGSRLRASGTAAFAAARALRILPGLAVVIAVLTLLLGPSVTALPAADYFSSGQTWRYVWRNLLIRDECCLPGVFPDNPLAGKMNYSLWTLQYEVECYGIVLCLGCLGCLRERWIAIAYALSLAASARWAGGAFGPFLAVFMGGAAMRVWNIRLSGRLAALCAVLWAVGLFVPGYRLFAATFGVYAVLFLALSPAVRRPSLTGRWDLSYGVYIWAYPIQQCVRMGMGPTFPWYWNACVSLPIALGFAALSWHFVEAPCLRFRSRPATHARPAPAGLMPPLA